MESKLVSIQTRAFNNGKNKLKGHNLRPDKYSGYTITNIKMNKCFPIYIINRMKTRTLENCSNI